MDPVRKIRHACFDASQIVTQPRARDTWQPASQWHNTNLFIDDTPGVQIAGLGRAVLALFTALLSLFNLDVQAKKLLPEGNFTTR